MPSKKLPTKKLLFICVANSARSQMAEGLARQVLGDAVVAVSAGSAPAGVNPFARRALEEIGIDTSGQHSKHIDSIDLATVDLVISLCAAEACPVALGRAEHRSWAMPDPAGHDPDATDAERMLGFRSARDHIHARMLALARELGITPVGMAAPARLQGAPTVAIVGWKNSGKTTLVERVVAELSRRGLRVATIKATHHDVEPDEPGKDSWRHRRAGAVETLLVGPNRWVLTHEGAEPCWQAMARLAHIDLVVVEGMRGAALPKIEVVAPDSRRPVLASSDPDVHLVAADHVIEGLSVPVLARDDVSGVADALLAMARQG